MAASCLKLTVNSDTLSFSVYLQLPESGIIPQGQVSLEQNGTSVCLSSPPVCVFDDGTFEDPLLPLLHMVVSGKDRRPNR